MMASNLPLEFQRFCKQTKYLRQLLRDTQRCFGEISSAACLNSDGQLVSAELRTNEIEDIEAIVKQPPCLVIYGQTCAAKAHIVNDIFNREILPVPVKREGTSGKPWRALRFRYGEETTVSLSLPDNFEMVNILSSYNKSKKTLAIEDIEISPENNTASSSAVLEVRLNHPLVQDGGLVVVSPSADQSPGLFDLHDKYSQDAVPIILYALAKNSLTEKELSELSVLREKVPDIAIFFVKVPSERPGIEPDSLSDRIVRKITRSGSGGDHSNRQDYGSRFFNSRGTLNLFQQLCSIGYLSILPASAALKPMMEDIDNYTVDSELIENYDHFVNLLNFTRRVLQSYLIQTTSLLNLVHTRCLQTFIMTAFDMARDMMITPRRLEFAREKESHLYESLMEIASKKQVEIREIIGETIQDMRAGLLDKAASYDFIGVDIAESGEVTSSRELKICTGQIQDLVLGSLNSAIAGKLLGSVDILKDSYTGVLTRCLESLEQSSKETSTESIKTSLALKEILNAAYQVEITVRAGASLVRVLLEKMKQVGLIHSMPWRTPPKIDEEWKRRVAAEMLDSLNEARLARSICSQIRERLKNSHETFAVALRQLEARHSGRLEKTEEQRLRLRKNFAPRVAKLVLESTSMKDYILFGMPHLGREIGRGQYGVVYSCDTWAGYNPCAIKTVVPPDDKHWNDLALEFYYTKNVPEHERIVALLGSVIDYTYGGGPAVLLIMDRLERDLYMAIKSGLNWMNRLQVAIDVIEGIRFLHSQGLVHRDIKLKNVLLDKSNRAKLTDLGFCKPEAMMSGSIVGTPIHMAPELFTGRYDNSVDVYAFGILFWYICAGHVKLPFAFEQCTNKEMLWTSVKRGMRPERLPQFDEECWKMMQHCWDGDQAKRPLLGTVEPQLRSIMERCATQKQPGHRSSSSSPTKRHPPTARNPSNSKS